MGWFSKAKKKARKYYKKGKRQYSRIPKPIRKYGKYGSGLTWAYRGYKYVKSKEPQLIEGQKDLADYAYKKRTGQDRRSARKGRLGRRRYSKPYYYYRGVRYARKRR